MNAYKDNPEFALSTLEKIAEEIPSGVSSLDVGRIVPTIGPNPKEITQNLREAIAEKLKGNVEFLWKTYDVSEKLSMVKNLERCEMGMLQPPLTAEQIKAIADVDYYKAVKETLQENIKKIKVENEDLLKTVINKSELIKSQIDDVKSCDFML